ncbi:MAG: hypothetical protein V3U75_12845 [Methylococcaceae bacterium]
MSFPLSLWKAFQKDLEASGLYRDNLADICGVEYHTIARWFRLVAPDDDLKPETPIPIDKFVLAVKAMKQYRALQIACNELGGFFTLHPHVDPQDELSAFEELDNLHSAMTALSETLRNAWSDKKITRKELPGITRMAIDAQARAQEIVEWAQEMADLGERR